MKSDLWILYTSGRHWTDRLKRLAARAPDPDIFGQGLILRDSSGWQITPEGRAFLDWLESGAASANVPVAEPTPPPPEPPPLAHWKRRRTVALEDQSVAQAIAYHEYEDFPRGRIVYQIKACRFIVYADRRLATRACDVVG